MSDLEKGVHEEPNAKAQKYFKLFGDSQQELYLS
jgi:hypothetical protein